MNAQSQRIRMLVAAWALVALAAACMAGFVWLIQSLPPQVWQVTTLPIFGGLVVFIIYKAYCKLRGANFPLVVYVGAGVLLCATGLYSWALARAHTFPLTGDDVIVAVCVGWVSAVMTVVLGLVSQAFLPSLSDRQVAMLALPHLRRYQKIVAGCLLGTSSLVVLAFWGLITLAVSQQMMFIGLIAAVAVAIFLGRKLGWWLFLRYLEAIGVVLPQV